MADNSQSEIGIRDIASIEEMGAVEELQREVWACADVDVVPRMMLHPAREVGGVLVGAYDGAQLVGFAFGFVGLERGRVVLHSHMLAVRHEYRGRDLGFRLKLAQRERALREGITRMTWTFDPLQSRNAHLNFAKLGVTSADYRVNYYSDVSTSPLHAVAGTDRLWVTWELDSPRVARQIKAASDEREGAELESARAELEAAHALISVGEDGEPVMSRLREGAGGDPVAIEIPEDINEVTRRDVTLARRWREATRAAFRVAIEAGYRVEEFFRIERGGAARGAYLLRWMKDEDQ
jgi:predicted GNAT superfamily acetyltransferase